ncbi:MAG TPA: hypothetical protein VJ873_07710, partial [bacterium]|nr:hypothetical protein [bacterium]
KSKTGNPPGVRRPCFSLKTRGKQRNAWAPGFFVGGGEESLGIFFEMEEGMKFMVRDAGDQ